MTFGCGACVQVLGLRTSEVLDPNTFLTLIRIVGVEGEGLELSLGHLPASGIILIHNISASDGSGNPSIDIGFIKY